MALHLVKLCVGCDGIEDLAAWIRMTTADKVKRGLPPEHVHRTRMMPKRVEEVLDGGSLYWIIKGQMRVRETIRDLDRKSTRLNSSHIPLSRMPSSA